MKLIYGLQDPVTKELRYIGKTKNLLKRLRHHIYKTTHGSQLHVHRWMRKLKMEKSLDPEIFEIDLVEDLEWEYWERFYIAYYRGIGCKLTNGTKGGECGNITPRKEETIQKHRNSANIMWKRPGIKQRHKIGLSNSWKDPIVKQKRKQSTKIAMNKPTVKNKVKRGLKNAWKRSEVRKRHKQAVEKRRQRRLISSTSSTNPKNILHNKII